MSFFKLTFLIKYKVKVTKYFDIYYSNLHGCYATFLISFKRFKITMWYELIIYYKLIGTKGVADYSNNAKFGVRLDLEE